MGARGYYVYILANRIGECFDDIEAIHREKRLKKWTRAWKIALIEKDNPNWIDLYPEIAAG